MQIFDNSCSYGHAVLGLITATAPKYFSNAIFIIFTSYEAARIKPNMKKIDSFLEYSIGYLIGKIL